MKCDSKMCFMIFDFCASIFAIRDSANREQFHIVLFLTNILAFKLKEFSVSLQA